jgi:glycosyltransferase involved in cell wall biosynthesis
VTAWSERVPLVVFGDDWGRHVSSMQHVFRAIVTRQPVVWVNAIGHRPPRLSVADTRRAWGKVRAALRPRPPASGPIGPAPQVIVEPRVLPWHQRRAVRAVNGWSLTRAIRGALVTHGLTEPPVVVTGSPPSVEVLGRLGERAAVYFCMDDFLHLPGVSAAMIAPLEQRLLERVDAVVATAESLTRSKRPRSGRAFYLPQGVNYEHFAAARPIPPEMARLPRPRIGFAGGVSACCDLDLIRRVADAVPHGSVVLVGPVSVDPAPLDRPNVHLLGARPYAELPAYVQAFDVGIIPYTLSEWTVAVDPLKLLEYLAAGIPVVTTAIPEVHKYRDAACVAESAGAFVHAVVAAAGENKDAARHRGQAVARRHTWEHRADELLRILEGLVAAPGAPVAVA